MRMRTLMGLVASALVAVCNGPCIASTDIGRGPLEDAIRAGNNAYFAGDFAGAESFFGTAILEDDTSAVAYNNRGLARYRQMDFVGAEADFEATKTRDPTYLAPYLNQGKTKAAQADWTAAVNQFDAGLVIDPSSAPLLYNKGWVYDETGQYANALISYDAALAADPTYLKAVAAKAVTLAKDTQPQLAVEAFYHVINTAEPGTMLAASAAYNLQLLRGPGVDFSSDAAAQDFQDGILDYTLSLYDSAATELASAALAENDVADIPWLQMWTEIKRHDTDAADAHLAEAYLLMPTLHVHGSYASEIYVDGIPRGDTPASVPVFSSRFDLTLRHLDAFNDRERSVPVYTDGTPGGATTLAITPGITTVFSDFAEVEDSDADWLGDEWEVAELGDLSQGPADDPDVDTVSNLLEYWHGSDPDLGDSDDDGISDADEIAGATDPAATDSDGDLVPDGWEVAYGLDPRGDTDLELDPDGDGLPHFGEWLLDGDPADPADPPTIYVNGVSGSDTTGDGSSLNPWATIQHAIGQAVTPTIVAIAEGAYSENLVLDQNIALVGSGAIGDTVVDGGDAGRVVSVNYATPAVVLSNLELTGGSVSGYGAGLFSDNSDVYLAFVRVRDNHTLQAYQHGGGVHVRNGHLRLAGSELIDNISPGSAAYGGGLYFKNGSVWVSNTTVSGSSGSQGAAIYGENCSFRLASSTLGHNGYKAMNVANCKTDIVNSIIWNNTWDLDRSGGRMTIDHSLIGDVNYDFNFDGMVRWLDNVLLDENPLFIDHGIGDLRLRPDSVCIDKGAGDLAPAVDVYGQARWNHPGITNTGSGTPDYVDFGAHELHDIDLDEMTDLWEIDNFGDLSHDGSGDSDDDDLSDKEEFDLRTDPNDDDSDDDGLPDGWEVINGLDPLDNSDDNGGSGDPDGDLLVNSDEFTEGTNPQHVDTERDGFQDGWEVDNGFAPLLWDADDDDDGDGLSNYSEYVLGTDISSATSPSAFFVNGSSGSDVSGDGSSGNPWATVQHAVDTVTTPARVQIAAGIYPERITLGGGIALVGSGSDTTVLDGELGGRTVTAVSGERLVLQDLAVINGSNNEAGGGFFADAVVRIAFDGVRFENNQTTTSLDSGGGALITNCTSLRINNCEFRNNRTLAGTSHGGAIYAEATTLSVVNSLFVGNDASARADGAILGALVTSVISCTFAGHPGVPLDLKYTDAEIINTVIWDNGSPITNDNSTISVAYSNLEDTALDGPGVLHEAPIFVDPATGDYRLDPSSAGVDAGNGDYAPPVDFFGISRNDLPEVPNTGSGTPDYVEMGFHEIDMSIFIDGFESGNSSAWTASVP